MIYILFFLGLVCLVKGGDWFVDAACGLARLFRLPELLIGATIVSIGTTLPEVMVSTTSALSGHSQIAYGNAIGSVICNTALIAAISIAVRPDTVDKHSLRLPVCFFFAAAVFYSAAACIFGYFYRSVGIVLLLLCICYMAANLRQMKSTSLTQQPDVCPQPDEAAGQPLWQLVLFLVLGAALIAVGADILVDNGTLIAQAMGVPESVIALTLVALGTSLPELATAITALAKGHSALSLGNIIGANVLNLVLVCGAAISLSPFQIPENSTLFGINASLVVEIPIMLAVMVILTAIPMIKGRLYRSQGILLLLIYAAFCVYQFVLG